MKTRRSEKSALTRSSSRLLAQGSACVSTRKPASVPAPSGARKLIDFPGGNSLQIAHDVKGKFSSAGANTVAQLSSLGRSASVLLSHAWMSAKGKISRWLKYIRAQQTVRSNSKRLQVSETISLGEKRFVAVIRVDGREFLVGGGATNVALLTQLDAKQSFDNLLTETMTVAKRRPAKRVRKQIVTPPVEQAGGQV